jgi:single-strand DNA-binding protein
MLNKIVIMGRLTRDPELRTTNQGTMVASFSIACERDYQPGGSEKQTDFIDCTAWRKTAEFVSKHFHKGSIVIVSGGLRSRKWQAKDGSTRVAVEIEAEAVYFGESKRDAAPAELHEEPGTGVGNPFVAPPKQLDIFAGEEDGELPF